MRDSEWRWVKLVGLVGIVLLLAYVTFKGCPTG